MNFLRIFFIYLLICSCSSINNKERIEKIDIALNLDNFADTYLKMNEYFDTKEIYNSDNIFVFPKRKTVDLPKKFEYEKKLFDTKKYLDSSYTQGFLVLHEDSISFESYYLKQNKNTRHISWSIAKSFVSALIGIAINEGYIESIEDNVKRMKKIQSEIKRICNIFGPSGSGKTHIASLLKNKTSFLEIQSSKLNDKSFYIFCRTRFLHS